PAQGEGESEEAGAASSARDQFLAAVSHELRTPLTPALFAASRLAVWDDLPEPAKELARTIERNIQFEARLIDDLLDVARINRDRIRLDFDAVDVHQILGEAIRICQSAAEDKDVTLTTHLVADAHFARADRVRLRQVFWNLLNNAIKFSDAGGSILIRSANVSETTVTVSIRDSGAGMSPAVLEHLFVPFERRPQDQESRMGLGLGLA